MVILSAWISPPTMSTSGRTLSLSSCGMNMVSSLCSRSSEMMLRLGKASFIPKYMTLCEAMSPSVTGSLAPSLVFPLLLSPMSCNPLIRTTCRYRLPIN